jgi:predicted nucleic acid-binding protein
VAITCFIPEAFDTEARRFMSARFAMQVPSSFAAECGNTIRKKAARRHELDQRLGREILEKLLVSPGQVHEAEERAVMAYDLVYEIGSPRLAIDDFIDLALAIALDCRIVTAGRLFCETLRATPFEARLLWVADPL